MTSFPQHSFGQLVHNERQYLVTHKEQINQGYFQSRSRTQHQKEVSPRLCRLSQGMLSKAAQDHQEFKQIKNKLYPMSFKMHRLQTELNHYNVEVLRNRANNISGVLIKDKGHKSSLASILNRKE